MAWNQYQGLECIIEDIQMANEKHDNQPLEKMLTVLMSCLILKR